MRTSIVRDASLTAAEHAVVRAAALGALLRHCGRICEVAADAVVAVRCTNDAELQRLNRMFADVDAPTDVLAFPGDGNAHVGDIAISVPRALTQADDGVAEVRLLAVHGFLHCLGHDHATATEARIMTELTRRLLPHQVVPDLVCH